MQAQDKKQSLAIIPLEIITPFGRLVIRKLLGLIIFSLFLLCIDNLYLHKNCPKGIKPSFVCHATPIVGNFGMTFLQAVVVIWFVDIGLKSQTIKEQY